ncbi:MAG: ATP-binding cassette domain-containing protein [Defluviitaleaceae bacterium]|nr:ATP-binding cassette domain-containing protein [Defluviitaleaceae bacterium]
MPQIEVRNLSKTYMRKKQEKGFAGMLRTMVAPKYETVQAVSDINFSIEKGEAVGYVGPNGSGKSTTIKMLSGILHPSAGTVDIGGLSPTKDRIKNNGRIGVVFGQRSQLWWDVPVIESFRLLKVLYNIPQRRYEENLEMLTDILGLKDLLGVPERQLSLGQKMRCNMAAVFLHDPEIVFLDEPTIGLDVAVKADIRALIKRINEERKTTFIVTSHDFQDIDALCRRIIIIDKGHIIIDSPIEEIRSVFGTKKTIRFELGAEATDIEDFRQEGVIEISGSENSLEMTFETDKAAAPKLIEFVSSKTAVRDISIKEPSIEAIITEILANQ